MKKIKCPNCLEKNPAEARNCKICGALLVPEKNITPENFVFPEHTHFNSQDNRTKIVMGLKKFWGIIFLLTFIALIIVIVFILGPRIPEFKELFELLKS